MPLLPNDFRIDQGKFKQPGILKTFLLKRYFNCVRSFIKGKTYNSICDAGCGEGVPLTILKPVLGSADLSGIDLSETKITYIRKNIPNGTFLEGSVYKIPFEENSFDLVLCLEVLEHLETPEIALKEIQRIAKQDIILGVPNEPIWSISNMMRMKYLTGLGNTPTHCQKWSSGTFRDFVSGYFSITEVKTVFPWTLVYATL